MKILQTVFDIMDYGGIVNHVELLAKGFQELGHKQEMVILRCSAQPPKMTKHSTEVAGSYSSHVANQVNTITGWYGANSIGYASKAGLKYWREYANKFDLIIHQLPVPKPDPVGWWWQIYEEIDPPQIAVAHDAHFRDAYPHMIDLSEALTGVSVTNPAGYAALEWYPGLRCFIGAPHVPKRWDLGLPWKQRPKRFVSVHVWKAWKHMDHVLRALPHLYDGIDNFIGGDGIEARYMRSKDKCKPKYRGLWKKSLRAGMNYHGLISPRKVMEAYTESRVMVDMSYSKKFAALGNHFNRSTIEAYNGGCVPLVELHNMKDPTGIFKAHSMYRCVDLNDGPKALAAALDVTIHLKPNAANDIVAAGRKLLMDHFHYRKSAEQFIELGKGSKRVGIYGKVERGKLTSEIKEARNEILRSQQRPT